MNHKEMIAEINRLLDEAEPIVLAKVIGARNADLAPGDGWLIRSDGGLESVRANGEETRTEGELKNFLIGEAGRSLESRQPVTCRFTEGAVEVELFLLPLAAPDSLVIAGAGHIAVPLADMAAQAGFRVTVIDDREDFAVAENFPRAAEVKAAPFSQALGALQGGPSAYVVIITRGHRHDRESLEAVLDKSLAYIGMIGSRRRVTAVLGLLRECGVPREKLNRIHSPIGLDIGSQTPAEIAVSILAELIAVRRRGTSPLSLSRKERKP